jgi:hypothetical protein
MELDERIYREICDLSQEGDQYLDDDNFDWQKRNIWRLLI